MSVTVPSLAAYVIESSVGAQGGVGVTSLAAYVIESSVAPEGGVGVPSLAAYVIIDPNASDYVPRVRPRTRVFINN